MIHLHARHQARIAIFALLLLLPVAAWITGQDYLVTIASRAVIFAIAAMALDFVLGRAGLVSLGHAAFLGVGGYMAAILAHHGIDSGLLHLGAALSVSALLALVTGRLAIKLQGMYFIMVTLAFAQMIAFVFIGLEQYGGDDGLPMHLSSLPAFASQSVYGFYGLALASLLIVALILHMAGKARFGRMLEGLHNNPDRMLALGSNIDGHKLAAWCLSAIITGYAGFLMVNLSLFVSPALMHWTLSALLIVMVVIGGAGSLWGAIPAAILVIALEVWLPEGMNAVTAILGSDSDPGSYWQILFGPVLVFVAIRAPGGIWPVLVRFFDESDSKTN